MGIGRGRRSQRDGNVQANKERERTKVCKPRYTSTCVGLTDSPVLPRLIGRLFPLVERSILLKPFVYC